jgi:hypothetical protein
MSVNWFEGGRRISTLLMVLVAAGGLAYVAFINEPTPMLSSRGPEMPWFVGDADCKYPSYQRVLPDLEWGGKNPGLALCFLALDNDKIPYAVAPTPPEEKARQAREEAEDRTRIARGEPPPIRLASPWYYTDDSYSPRVDAYVAKSVADLKVTRELREQLNKTPWRFRAHKRAFKEALPWVLGLCIGIWLITAVIGWIVRGFAGVPTGQDFRPVAKD